MEFALERGYFLSPLLEPLLDQGYRIHTLSYRGHGESEGRERINHWRLSDYVSDVVSILNALSEPAIVVGHSWVRQLLRY